MAGNMLRLALSNDLEDEVSMQTMNDALQNDEVMEEGFNRWATKAFADIGSWPISAPVSRTASIGSWCLSLPDLNVFQNQRSQTLGSTPPYD